MSDRRHRQSRATLPEGYQFGEGRPCAHYFVAQRQPQSESYRAICLTCGHDAGEVDFDGVETIFGVGTWRAPHENAAAQLKRRQADASRCPQCGQPANLMASRQTVMTDAQTGRRSAVIERNNYCPSPFHFDAAQRTGDETV